MGVRAMQSKEKAEIPKCICGHFANDHEPDGEPRPMNAPCSLCECGSLSVWV